MGGEFTSDISDIIGQIAKMGAPSQHTISTLQRGNYNYADRTYEILIRKIRQFEDELDAEHETAIMLSSFGQSVTLAVESIEYANPSTLIFCGYVEGQPATLIQHMSQLNFLLCSVKRAAPEKPKKKIGFVPPSED